MAELNFKCDMVGVQVECKMWLVTEMELVGIVEHVVQKVQQEQEQGLACTPNKFVRKMIEQMKAGAMEFTATKAVENVQASVDGEDASASSA